MEPELVLASSADAPRIADLLNAISEQHYGEADLTAAEVATWFEHEEMEVLLAEANGRLVGYADRWREAERDRAWLDVRAPEGEVDTGALLLRESERRAEPDVDPGALAMTYVAGVDETMRGVVEAAGYTSIRSAYRMSIALEAPPAPEWPDGIEVATYTPADEAAVHEAHQESFRDHWEHKDETIEEWRKWMIAGPLFDPSLWFVAHDGDEVAGDLALHRSLVRRSRAWVLPGARRAATVAAAGSRARAPAHSFVEMDRRGMTRASLGVDAENLTGAVALYERAGMHVERRPTAGRRSSGEPSTRTLSRLPHIDGGRARSRVPVPLVRSEFAAGLVRVPRAWGDGGEAMARLRSWSSPTPRPP